MRRLLELVLDRGSVFELTTGFGRSQVTALARLAGRPVGVLASDSRFSAGNGAIETRPVAVIDARIENSAAERAATIRHGVTALMAVQQCSVPWASVVVRKSYGVAAAAHYGIDGYVVAWPSAETGALPLEGGVAVAFRREIEAADDPAALRRELEERFSQGRSPFPRAESFGVNDLLDPRRTRPALCEWIEWIQPALARQLGERRYAIRP